MKNQKYFLLAALGLMAAPALAQETYQDAKLAENSLNGTARYVGMGGAMEALGADISTIGSNPAGVGLFRKSQVSVSVSVVAQTDAENYTQSSYSNTRIDFQGKKSHVSFDQIGIVWSPSHGRSSYVNLAFNFHKSADFGQILNAAAQLGGASQSKITAAKYASKINDIVWTGVDANYERLMTTHNDNNQHTMDYYDGKEFLFGQYQKGYIGEYDFNISGSINNRVWLGLTVGIHDVRYRSNSMYSEVLEPSSDFTDAGSDAWEDLRIDGTGFDIKAGVIFRPVADSPFRIGAYVNTPVYYDLSMKGIADLRLFENSADNSVEGNCSNASTYDFRLNTPWKLGASLGHTIGNFLALGATYEYAWYDHMDNRVKNAGYYDYYGDYYETSSSDTRMNENTRYSLKGVSTVKLGVEYKPVSMLAIRLGYNYVSPMYNSEGYRNQMISSPGTAYASSSDYTNWKAINRITAGVGFSYLKWNIDVAYQYSAQKGDFYPFMDYKPTANSTDISVKAPSVEVKNNRHQILMTLGYKF